MRLRVVGGYGGELPGCRSSSLLLDGDVALDAGSLSSGLALQEQTELRHIFLSHAHADHCASLAYLSENVFAVPDGPIELISGAEVLDALRRHLFNDVLWPDMVRLGVFAPVVLDPDRPQPVGRLTVTPVLLPHTVPCFGYHLDDGRRGLLYAGDMGPNDELWALANRVTRLDAVVLECSFPSRMEGLARVSQHLTPRLLAAELRKLKRPCRVLASHVKPPYHAEIVAEIAALGLPGVEVLRQDTLYEI